MDPETEEPEAPAPEPESGLGDSGKRALAAERKARRDAEKKVADLEGRLKAIEDRDKSDSERHAEENATLKKDLETATATSARFKVALEKGLSITQAKRLVGSTEDELSADADELLVDLGVSDTQATSETGPAMRPRPDLTPGSGDPDATPEETNPAKLAALVPRGF